MKTIKLILLCVLALNLVACADDDPYSIESVIIGRSWTGDVGMSADCGCPIESTFHFYRDGFGEEWQYCSHCRREYGPYRFRWEWEDCCSNNLILDYGRDGVSSMYDLHVRGTYLYGVFYLNHYNSHERGFNFELRMN